MHTVCLDKFSVHGVDGRELAHTEGWWMRMGGLWCMQAGLTRGSETCAGRAPVFPFMCLQLRTGLATFKHDTGNLVFSTSEQHGAWSSESSSIGTVTAPRRQPEDHWRGAPPLSHNGAKEIDLVFRFVYFRRIRAMGFGTKESGRRDVVLDVRYSDFFRLLGAMSPVKEYVSFVILGSNFF